MIELYTKEDYIMYLLSGGDTVKLGTCIIGPESKFQMSYYDAITFRKQVTKISGHAYFLPTYYFLHDMIESGCIEFRRYWCVPTTIGLNSNWGATPIDGKHHTILVRYPKFS